MKLPEKHAPAIRSKIAKSWRHSNASKLDRLAAAARTGQPLRPSTQRLQRIFENMHVRNPLAQWLIGKIRSHVARVVRGVQVIRTIWQGLMRKINLYVSIGRRRRHAPIVVPPP